MPNGSDITSTIGCTADRRLVAILSVLVALALVACSGAGDGSQTTGPTSSATYYHDADGDTFGDPNDSTVVTGSENQPSDHVSDDTDCDDDDAGINPDATEVPDDTLDNDCDGDVDETSYYYEDGDGDGFGNASVDTVAESQPAGYVSDDTDCDDTDASVNPGADEVGGDGIDNDCDGQVDESS